MAEEQLPLFRDGKFRFQTVELFETEQLGVGSYGKVCKAQCDELPCAAKILHEAFVSAVCGKSNTQIPLEKFNQECQMLSAVKHPHIVQYLGTYKHPESHLPVLLMELMDDSLTRYLERASIPLPYHLQVNFCHDVALALVYLHTNGIIHRDLSSNNVLLTASLRAKVADFGMSKLVEVHSQLSTMTQCPGCVVYMAPEALKTHPVYTEKLDDFSLGVLIIQIITRRFPAPTDPWKTIRSEESPTGTVQMPVLEIERRRNDIDQIEPTHALLLVSLKCLEQEEEKRPSAQELCRQFAHLKEDPKYIKSAQQSPCPWEQLRHEIEEKKEEVTNLQKQLKSQEETSEKLRQELSEQSRNLRCAIEEKGQRNLKLQGQVQQQEETITELQQKVLRQDKHVRELEEELQQLKGSSSRKLHIRWDTCQSSPYKMYRGTATAAGNRVYFNPNESKMLHVYDSEERCWSTPYPDCPYTDFGLTIVGNLLTTVGGNEGEPSTSESTNTLLSLTKGQKWTPHFPSMPTKRFEPAVVCSHHLLVVAGGRTEFGGGRLNKVEVMDTVTLQWHKAARLPTSVSGMSITVVGENVYLLGGFEERGSSSSVFTCTLDALRSSLRPVSRSMMLRRHPRARVWQVLQDIPVYYSTCVSIRNQLFAVGGLDSQQQPSTAIYTYDLTTNSWQVISHMPTARYDCLVSILSNSQLIVAGGCTVSSWEQWSDVVEMGTLTS